jgi:hypothetical protein
VKITKKELEELDLRYNLIKNKFKSLIKVISKSEEIIQLQKDAFEAGRSNSHHIIEGFYDWAYETFKYYLKTLENDKGRSTSTV